MREVLFRALAHPHVLHVYRGAAGDTLDLGPAPDGWSGHEFVPRHFRQEMFAHVGERQVAVLAPLAQLVAGAELWRVCLEIRRLNVIYLCHVEQAAEGRLFGADDSSRRL